MKNIQANKNKTKEQHRLMLEGRCFICKERGHLAKYCSSDYREGRKGWHILEREAATSSRSTSRIGRGHRSQELKKRYEL